MKLLPYFIIGGLTSSALAQQGELAEEAKAPLSEVEIHQADYEKRAAKHLGNRKATQDELEAMYAEAVKFPSASVSAKVVQFSMFRIRDAKKRVEVEKHFFATYMDDNEMARFASNLGYRSYEKVADKLQKILVGSNNKKVRGYAALSMANSLGNSLKYSKLDEAKKALYKSRRISVLKALTAVPNMDNRLARRASAALFKLENLSIGSVAPEIVGTDHEDKEFKLSDYRGKVVLLDFWGIW